MEKNLTEKHSLIIEIQEDWDGRGGGWFPEDFFFFASQCSIIIFTSFLWAYIFFATDICRQKEELGLTPAPYLASCNMRKIDIIGKKFKGPCPHYCSLCHMLCLVPALLPQRGQATRGRFQHSTLGACHQWNVSYSTSTLCVWSRRLLKSQWEYFYIYKF